MLTAAKKEFIEFMMSADVLRFGDFTTKSGRKTPYFVNTGNYKTGLQNSRLGEFYAAMVKETIGDNFDAMFGPAYKGIPLATSVSGALARNYGIDKPFFFNRKEAKDHGETGILLGSQLKDGDRVVMIEDVTTSGKSIEETYPILKAQADVKIKGLIVSLNRMEKGKGDKSALEEVKEQYGFPTAAIVSMADVVEHLYNHEYKGKVIINDELKAAIDAYYEQYGAK